MGGENGSWEGYSNFHFNQISLIFLILITNCIQFTLTFAFCTSKNGYITG